uniref:Uncharacterized protein n=1 Tax=Globodera rostochiensis TaxID=31243 RepID=A0A914HNP7_GLORO
MGIVQSVINSVETVCNAVGSVCNAVVRVVDEIIIPAAVHFGSFFTSAASRCANAVMSSYENANAIERIGEELKEMDMDYITDAFVQAAKSKLMCYRCNKKVQYIDDLCYCEISDTQCHHGTTCCTRRRIQAVAYS